LYLSIISSIVMIEIVCNYKIPIKCREDSIVRIKRLRNLELTNRTEEGRRGLSVVITTLILLVVAVLLAAVVSYYATNVTMTRTNVENVRICKDHIWVNETGAVAACKIQNLGGKDILIDQFSVRSIEAEWSSVYIYRVPTGTSQTADLNVTSSDSLIGTLMILFGKNYTQATDDIPLISGAEIILYVKNPGNIQLDDIGTAVNMGVTTNNAKYITESSVESGTDQ